MLLWIGTQIINLQSIWKYYERVRTFLKLEMVDFILVTVRSNAIPAVLSVKINPHSHAELIIMSGILPHHK